MSQQFRSQSQSNNGGKGRQKQDDGDAFMRLVQYHMSRLHYEDGNSNMLYSPIVRLLDVSVILVFHSRQRTY